jgi:SNF2 family DNA or RNA helicase
MLIIKLKGGLGNQLFQYAFGRLLSLKRNEELKLDKSGLGAKADTYRSYALDNFNIKENIAEAGEAYKFEYPYGKLSKLINLFKTKFLRQFHIGYENNLLKSKAHYFSGFFQSYKYLEPIRSELLKEITLKENLEEKFQELLAEMKNVNSVALHIRRGDYVSDEKTKAAHFICDLAYYEKAIALVKEKIGKVRFFVFSDDIIWAKENLKGEEFVFVSNPEIFDFEELVLMSRAKHNIIANSSFSFWSAWLNQNPDKIVIAPALWNKRYGKHYKDLLPENWTKI